MKPEPSGTPLAHNAQGCLTGKTNSDSLRPFCYKRWSNKWDSAQLVGPVGIEPTTQGL